MKNLRILISSYQTKSANEIQIQERYSDKEIAAIQKFRVLVDDALSADYLKTNTFLVRWLRDRDFDLDKANQKLRTALEWRKRNGIDRMFEDPDLQRVNKTCPVQYSGFDRTGCPVVTMAFGTCNVRKFALSGFHFSRHLQAGLELGLIGVTQREKEGLNGTQMVYLFDMAGFNARQHLCLACIPVFTEIAVTFEAYYPQILKVLMVVNSPRIFGNILPLVKPILTPETFNRLKIFGIQKAEWQKPMLELISPDQLTPQYGGTRTMEFRKPLF